MFATSAHKMRKGRFQNQVPESRGANDRSKYRRIWTWHSLRERGRSRNKTVSGAGSRLTKCSVNLACLLRSIQSKGGYYETPT